MMGEGCFLKGTSQQHTAAGVAVQYARLYQKMKYFLYLKDTALQGTTFANKDSIKIRVMMPTPARAPCVACQQPAQLGFLCTRGVESCFSLNTVCRSGGRSSEHATRRRPSWTIRGLHIVLAPAVSSESSHRPRFA